MITILKLGMAAMLGVAVLNPGLTPRGEDCECKGKADTATKMPAPKAADCECKGDT
jgi:hypothetical protein